MEAKIKDFDVEREELFGKYLLNDIMDASGEVIALSNTEITDSILDSLL